MSIIYQIPHTSRFIMTKNIFTATFNSPTAGKYDFGKAANTGVSVQKIFKGTLYLIERVSIGGTVPEGDYLESIETIPELKLRTLKTGAIIYKLPMPIVNYIDDQDIVGWVLSDIGDDELIADMTGVLDQTANLVGIASVKINISYSIYAIEDINFKIRFRDRLSSLSGSQISGA